MAISDRLPSERDGIARDIPEESLLNCDELWWPVSGSSGGAAMVALGKKACLARVVESATIERVREMRPDYQGIVGQDSKAIGLHAGSDHQMCRWHQHRLCRKEPKYGNPQGRRAQVRIRPGSHQPGPLPGRRDIRLTHQGGRRPVPGQVAQRADESHPRGEARCEPEGCENYRLDEDGRKTINRHIKRHHQEGCFCTTHMYRDGIVPDNNAVKRVSRKFVAIQNDGRGNGSPDGMEANPVSFTTIATDRINWASFFDHPVRASSGDG